MPGFLDFISKDDLVLLIDGLIAQRRATLTPTKRSYGSFSFSSAQDSIQAYAAQDEFITSLERFKGELNADYFSLRKIIDLAKLIYGITPEENYSRIFLHYYEKNQWLKGVLQQALDIINALLKIYNVLNPNDQNIYSTRLTMLIAHMESMPEKTNGYFVSIQLFRNLYSLRTFDNTDLGSYVDPHVSEVVKSNPAPEKNSSPIRSRLFPTKQGNIQEGYEDAEKIGLVTNQRQSGNRCCVVS